MQGGQLRAEMVAGLLPELTPRNRIALEVWQQLGKFDWAGIALLLELHDIDDAGDLVERLILIRDALRAGEVQN